MPEPRIFPGFFQRPKSFSFRIGGELSVWDSPRVMGILNITPDSFYTGSRTQQIDVALGRAQEMLEQGADMLDLGGVSTRPGSQNLSESQEADRLLPVLEAIGNAFPEVLISVDTFRSGVARQALRSGARIINDISAGLFDAEMLQTVARQKGIYLAMHLRGTFDTMHHPQSYSDIAVEVAAELAQRKTLARAAGIADVWLDPGFGFSKSIVQNFELLGRLSHLHLLDCPLVVGLSRKSMIWKTLKNSPEKALNGTTVLHMAALVQGAHLLRVHDVAEAKETISLFENLCSPE